MAPNAAAEQEAFISKEAKPSTMKALSNFLYTKDPATGETRVLGRTGKSWLAITGFYIIFYACLAGFFAICLAVFMATVDQDKPRWWGDGSIIGSRPGLGYQPWLEDNPDSTMIKFKPDDKKSYEEYVKQMRSFLDVYYDDADKYDEEPGCTNNKTDASAKPCSYLPELKQDLNDLDLGCNFDTKEDMQKCNFGYDKGTPVIMLTLNRMLGWTPSPYQEVPSEDDGFPSAREYHSDHVLLSCEGEYAADEDNIGEISYSPQAGLPSRFYPFKGKTDSSGNRKYYQQPVGFAKFLKPTTGVLVMVECKAWAKNIEHHRQYKLGMSHFEVLVEFTDPEKE